MDREKYIDESWKESVANEKEKLDSLLGKGKQPGSNEKKEESAKAASNQDEEAGSEAGPEQSEEGSLSFLNYLSSLSYQAMIFLGLIPHPATNETEKNLEQAKFIIDTLVILRNKTKGNLNKKESDMLNTSLYELQMHYVELAQKEGVP